MKMEPVWPITRCPQ